MYYSLRIKIVSTKKCFLLIIICFPLFYDYFLLHGICLLKTRLFQTKYINKLFYTDKKNYQKLRNSTNSKFYKNDTNRKFFLINFTFYQVFVFLKARIYASLFTFTCFNQSYLQHESSIVIRRKKF